MTVRTGLSPHFHHLRPVLGNNAPPAIPPLHGGDISSRGRCIGCRAEEKPAPRTVVKGTGPGAVLDVALGGEVALQLKIEILKCGDEKL